MKPQKSHRENKGVISRHKARELALQLLYATEITGNSLQETKKGYKHLEIDPEFAPKIPMNEFTLKLLNIVLTHKDELDELLKRVIMHWRLERLTYIERNLLRLATAEIFHFEDIPPKVTINEYIEIAKDYGDNEAPSFINGILDRVARESPKGKDIKQLSD
jgi:N utilization substance protein B